MRQCKTRLAAVYTRRGAKQMLALGTIQKANQHSRQFTSRCLIRFALSDAWLTLPAVAAVRAKASNQVQSILNRFALVAAALRMAIEGKLLPWSIDETDCGVVACMARCLKSRNGRLDLTGEVLGAIERIRAILAADLHGRFIHLRIGGDGKLDYANMADASKRDTLGYVKDGRILVEPTAWRGVLCAGHDPEKTAQHLKAEGLLIADETGGKLQRQGKVKRGGDVVKARFYVLDQKILDDAAATGPKESVTMIRNSVFVAPESFSGGTGGTGGTLWNSARQSGTAAWDRWDRRAPAHAAETKNLTSRSPRYHRPVPPKSTKLPAVPPVPPVTRKRDSPHCFRVRRQKAWSLPMLGQTGPRPSVELGASFSGRRRGDDACTIGASILATSVLACLTLGRSARHPALTSQRARVTP